MGAKLYREAEQAVRESFADYLRREQAGYLGGGAAMQKNADVALGTIHRATADLDIIKADAKLSRETFPIGPPEMRFTVDLINGEALLSPFKPQIISESSSNFVLLVQGHTRLNLSYEGEVHFESRDSALPNKANLMITRLSQRGGETAKDLFDIGVLARFTDLSNLDQTQIRERGIIEAFHLSCQFVHLYPKKMAKRVSSDLDVQEIAQLARSGAEAYGVSADSLQRFAEANLPLLPVMLLSAANECVHLRMPYILSFENADRKFAIQINDQIISALARKDQQRLNSAMDLVIRKARELRQASMPGL